MNFPGGGPGHYTLIGQTPVRCDDMIEWATWYEHADRHVFSTRVGDYWVSTVFLGLDHNWGRGRPILFETMIFAYFESIFPSDEHWHTLRQQELKERGLNEDFLDYQQRWHDWSEAEAGHETMVRHVEAATGAKRWEYPTVLDALDAAVTDVIKRIEEM